MKSLLLMRHAKSSWDNKNQTDFERPLNPRGLKTAKFMGEFMRQQKIQPDLVISSPAERAKQTADLLIKSAAITAELRYDERIYGASSSRLVEVISQIEDAARTVLLVGHNPGLEELLKHLTAEPQHLPTAALAKVTLDVERWGEVSEQSGQLEWLVKPKELMEK